MSKIYLAILSPLAEGESDSIPKAFRSEDVAQAYLRKLREETPDIDMHFALEVGETELDETS